jgi:hypothetical protein
MPDGVLLVQGVVDVEHGAAGVAPEVLDPFGLQAAYEDFRAIELGGERKMKKKAVPWRHA